MVKLARYSLNALLRNKTCLAQWYGGRFQYKVIEQTTAWCTGQRRIQRIPHAIRDKPSGERKQSAEHFLNHFVIIHHRAKQHNIPEQLQCSDGNEQNPNIRCVLLVVLLHQLKLRIAELVQRIRAGLLLRQSIVFLVAQMLANALPSDDRSCLFHQHQARVDQNEYMTGNVEAIPEVTSLQTIWFWVEATHIAASVDILDEIERFGPQKPEAGSDHDSWQMLAKLTTFVISTKDTWGHVEKRCARR